MATRSRTRAATAREQAQARRLGGPTGRLWVGVLVGGGGYARTSIPELGSGVRALCMCSCDANVIWENYACWR
eukprot:6059092-Pleurochrysis_carterae.AAC.1